MELLSVEVHYLEIVLRLAPGGFPARPWSLGALQNMPFKKSAEVNYRGGIKKNTATLYIIDFKTY